MSLTELLAVLDSMASDPAEQTVGLSELDHGLQCAFELAVARPDDPALQLAGLVHDIGHRFGSDEDHGVLGAEQVRGLFGDRVAGLVEAHVPAKRYLVTTDTVYRSRLSAESRRTLEVQGGALAGDELSSFLSSPYGADALALRRADDAAKVPGRPVWGLDHWTPVLRAQALEPGRPRDTGSPA